MIQLEYSTDVNRGDWNYVLQHAPLANVFHTPEYFDIQTSDVVGHKLLYMCCYDQDEPVGIIVGYQNTFGYHQGFIEVGTKSGGCPLMIDEYDQRPDAGQIKNAFIEEFARQYLEGQQFLFYPCFHLQNCIFEEPSRRCTKQYDSTAFIDLQQDEELLWKKLRDKGRNMVRYARRHGVTARIANDVRYFDQFYQLYKDIRTRLKTQYIGYDEIRAKFDNFTSQGLADFWVAFLDETPLAYSFMWTYKQMLNYVYTSSHREYWKYKPNNLLQWEIICHYKQHGYTLYNMWGLRNMNLSEKDALRPDREIEGYGKFKLSFGAEIRDLVRYVRIGT